MGETSTWLVWFHPDVRVDREAVLVLLDDTYLDFAITFAETDVEAPEAVQHAEGPSVICVYPDARGGSGIGGAAFLDPGNKYAEHNCGRYRGQALGVFDWLPFTERDVADFLAHEIGHSLGLLHYRFPHLDLGNIMNASLKIGYPDPRHFGAEDREYLFEILGRRDLTP